MRTNIIAPLLARAGLPAAGEYQPTPGLGRAADLIAQDLALINLSLLGTQGPAGFLAAHIQQHFSDHPEQLRTLARHSASSGVLLTPIIIPRKDESNRAWPGDIALQQWLQQRDRFHAEHERHAYEDLCLSIHQDVLAHAEEMRYPLTLHMIQVLEQAQHHPEQPWQRVWQDYLTRQMNTGQYLSYQECALLWGTLFQEPAELQKLAALLLSHLRSDGLAVQRSAERFLATLADSLRMQEELSEIDEDAGSQFSPYLRYWLDISELYYIQDIQNIRIWRYLRDMHNLQNLRDMQGEEALHNPPYIHTLQALLLTPEVTSFCLARLALVPLKQDEHADLLTILLGRVLSALNAAAQEDSTKMEFQRIIRGLRLDIAPLERNERSSVVLEILRYLHMLSVYLPVDTAEEVCIVLQLAEQIPEPWVRDLCDAAQAQAHPEVLEAGARLLKASKHRQVKDMDHDHPVCDICVVCALSEAAQVFLRETSEMCGVTFQRAFGPHTRREYRYATIENREREALTIYLTWLPRTGPEEMALHFKPVLAELQPRFAAMTGICAGEKGRVACGDLIIAERAFLSDTGKIVGDTGGRKHLYDTNTYQPHPDILQFVQMFDAWQTEVARLRRPPSRRQQRAWLLTTFLQKPALCIFDLPRQELEHYAPAWAQIVREFQSGPHPLVTQEGLLQDLAGTRALLSQQDVLAPEQTLPKRHIAAMASGSAVRGDTPFQEIQVPVRGALAIDMEGATFYRTVAEFAGLRGLLVKGVCDYADPDKDDTYHDFAAAVSARYLLCFIKDYVTSGLMARSADQLPIANSEGRDLQPPGKDQQQEQSTDNLSSQMSFINPTAPRTLDKGQRAQLHRVLLNAFPSRSELKQMVDFGLDHNLDRIASIGNLEQTIFELIKWAETHSRERALIHAAFQANPSNEQLRAFVLQLDWFKDSDA